MKSFLACFSGVLTAALLLTSGCGGASPEEARFNADTISYFKMLNEQAMGAAQAMASASDLDRVKGVLLEAKSLEGAGYERYLGSRAQVAISNNVHNIAQDSDESHRLFQQAMSEFLMYWEDRNTTHIPDGSGTLNRCTALALATVRKINAGR